MEPTATYTQPSAKEYHCALGFSWILVNMDYSLALLFSLMHILNVGTAAPMQQEVAKMKLKVKRMADQLLVRLENVQVLRNVTLSSPVDELDSVSSVITVLEGYNSLISDTFDGVSQVKSEISSLAGYLHNWRQGHCAGQRAKPLVQGPLQALQISKQFPITVSIEALMRVKEFLTVLKNNLGHLETC